MSLTENKGGNFYPINIPEVDWHCDYLWSTHRGCPNDCIYCSSKKLNNRFKSLGDPASLRRLKGEWKYGEWKNCHRELEIIKRSLLPNASIFLSPFNDIMTVPEGDIRQIFDLVNYSRGWWFDRDVIGHKEKSNFNIILQTKNPSMYFDYIDLIPEGSWLGTTIETDDTMLYKEMNISKSPIPPNRIHNFIKLKEKEESFSYFVTIEPIMSFSGRLLFWIKELQPDLIFMGANTSKMQLPGPTNDELIEFIYALYDTIGIEKVYLKSNIRRLIPTFYDGWKLTEKQNEEKEANDRKLRS